MLCKFLRKESIDLSLSPTEYLYFQFSLNTVFLIIKFDKMTSLYNLRQTVHDSPKFSHSS